MAYFYLEPEVAGGIGENTVMNSNVHPPFISKLNYHFDDWLGDVLLESFPAFIVTAEAKDRLESTGVTGVRFDEVEVTTSDVFAELHPGRQLPEFVWLLVEGKPGQDDFGLAADGRLVVSEKAFAVLRDLGISHALVSEFDS